MLIFSHNKAVDTQFSMRHGDRVTVWQKPDFGGAGVTTRRRCLQEAVMLIKLDLSGEQYYALLEVLQSDANHYKELGHEVGWAEKLLRIPFVAIKSAKTDAGLGRDGALMYHNVTLEVEETYCAYSSDFGNVPLSVLQNIFDALDLYPSDDKIDEAEKQEAS